MRSEKLSDKTGEIIQRDINRNIHNIIGNIIQREIAKKNFVNKFVYIFGFLGPIITSFQALKIFLVKNAAGISLIYWGAYLAVALLWFGYGYTYKDKPIMISYGLWVIIEIIVLNGIIIYG